LAANEQAKEALGQWLTYSQAERKRFKLPETQKRFAERWGVSPRSVIRWIQQDPLVEAVREREEQRVKGKREPAPLVPLPDPQAEPEPVPELDLEDYDPASAEFLEIRRNIAELARQGDQKALDTYMRWFGKEILEEQRAQRESSFSDMSDEALVESILALVGRPAVERWLRAQVG
jgi:hypothetical protein